MPDPDRRHTVPAAGLRLEVAALRARHAHGRRARTVLHVGLPGRPDRVVVDLATTSPPADRRAPSDRVDLLLRVLDTWAATGTDGARRGGPCTAWLWRAGGPDPVDEDASWHRALRRAAALSGRQVSGLHVVTSGGWRDVAGGALVRWERLRVRGRGPGARVGAVVRAVAAALDPPCDLVQSQVCTGALVCMCSR